MAAVTYENISEWLTQLGRNVDQCGGEEAREAAFQQYVSGALAAITVADGQNITAKEAALVLRPLFFPDELRRVLVSDGDA